MNDPILPFRFFLSPPITCHVITFLLVWILFLSGAGAAMAAGPAQASRELLLFMEVPTVVTAARREQPLTKAPSTITVITAEEIRQSGATSLPELLRAVPGLDFFRTSASDVSITARGLNVRASPRMQVFIDGRSVYEDFFGIVLWHHLPLSLEEIERVEIVRSPASALFGANAFSGVIQIITKSPEELKGAHVSTTIGDAGTWIGSLILAGVINQVGYKISLGYDRANQFPNPLIGRTDEERGREDLRGNFLIDYRFSEASRISLSGGLDNLSKKDVASGAGIFAGDGTLGFVQVKYSKAGFRSQFVFNRLDAAVRSPFLLQEGSVLAETYQGELQHSLSLGEKNILMGGISYRVNIFDSDRLVGDRKTQGLFALFLQDEYSLLANLAVTAGVRVDTHPETGINLSPRGSVVYSPWDAHTFRVSVGKAFRNPSFLENFLSLEVPTLFPSPSGPLPGIVRIMGERDLAPEGIFSYELGYQGLFLQRVKARVDLFYNRFDQLISLEPTGFSPGLPPSQEFREINGEDGSVLGGEVGLEFFIAPWLRGFLNYSYQERKTADRRFLGVAPHHKGNAGLTFSFKNGLSATLLVHHVGEAEGNAGVVDPYTLVNLYLGYRFKLLGHEAELAVQAFNLFNDVHREFPGGDLIERRVSGTVRYHL